MLVYAAIKSCSQDDSQGQGQPANPEEAQDFAQMGIRMIKDEYYRYALRHLTSNWVNMMWDWSQYILLGPLDGRKSTLFEFVRSKITFLGLSFGFPVTNNIITHRYSIHQLCHSEASSSRRARSF